METRSGNKKVTLVTNLETYGVNPQDLAKEIRVGAAASSSVSAAPGQKAGAKQLLIQGNQVNLVVAILTEKYNIDKKHIAGMEKGEKKKKRWSSVRCSLPFTRRVLVKKSKKYFMLFFNPYPSFLLSRYTIEIARKSGDMFTIFDDKSMIFIQINKIIDIDLW